jgi:hypothetical protein
MINLVNEIRKKTTTAIFIIFAEIWVFGNILWLIIVNLIANAIGVSWLDVEHYVRFTSINPSLREIHKENVRNGSGDPDFAKNIQFKKQ